MDKLLVVGAYDRHNYGDLLFPLLLEKVISTRYKRIIKLEFYSTIDSDMSEYGGVKSAGIKQLFRADVNDKSVVIVSGGDVLTSSWAKIIGYTQPAFIQIMLKIIHRILPQRILDYSISRLFKLTSIKPFVYSRKYFTNGSPKIVYNCVGGSRLGFASDSVRRKINSLLNEAYYISVRDSSTKKFLEEYQLDGQIHLCPDSAIIMSDFHSKTNLKSNLDYELKTFLDSSPKYFCFQSALHYAKGDIKTISEQLLQICCDGYSVLLLAIGKASGHSDQYLIEKILRTIPEDRRRHFHYFESADSIEDIMASIAFSKVFAGTSLHGNITALSFSVPHFSLDKVKKLMDFQKDWDLKETPIGVEYNNMYSSFKECLKIDSNELRKCSEGLKKLVYKNYDEVFLGLS